MASNNRVWYGSNWIRKDKRLAIYLRDNFLCVYCSKNLKRAKGYGRQLDHVIAVARGGTNSERNLVTCCKACNEAKNGGTLGAFCVRRRLDFLTIERRVAEQTRQPLPRELAKQLLAGKVR